MKPCMKVTAKHKTRSNCADRKLIINSHVKYHTALDHLLASLKKYEFPLAEAVVFRGGAKADSEPQVRGDGITFVDLKLNSFDMTAFSGLSKHKNDSCVCARLYFYIHDTTSIGPCFSQVFREIKAKPHEVITPGTIYFSNQCVFGHSIVDKYGDAFDWEIDKKAGFNIETGGCADGPEGQRACPLSAYASKRTLIPERTLLPDEDVYNTREPRKVVYYRDWDLYKHYLYQPDTFGDNYRKDLGLNTNPTTMVTHPTWASNCSRTTVSSRSRSSWIPRTTKRIRGKLA